VAPKEMVVRRGVPVVVVGVAGGGGGGGGGDWTGEKGILVSDNGDCISPKNNCEVLKDFDVFFLFGPISVVGLTESGHTHKKFMQYSLYAVEKGVCEIHLARLSEKGQAGGCADMTGL